MNITAEQRLALARAVYPEHDWFEGLCGSVVFNAMTDPITANPFIPFYPEGNYSQLLDVLCWLFNQRGRNGNFHELTPWHVKQIYFTEDDNEPVTSKTFAHKNTPASLSDAIVRAAVRVREGE